MLAVRRTRHAHELSRVDVRRVTALVLVSLCDASVDASKLFYRAFDARPIYLPATGARLYNNVGTAAEVIRVTGVSVRTEDTQVRCRFLVTIPIMEVQASTWSDISQVRSNGEWIQPRPLGFTLENQNQPNHPGVNSALFQGGSASHSVYQTLDTPTPIMCHASELS